MKHSWRGACFLFAPRDSSFHHRGQAVSVSSPFFSLGGSTSASRLEPDALLTDIQPSSPGGCTTNSSTSNNTYCYQLS
ncbi:hypothetical protein C8R44DRAFT_987104 [Mycena epipterygia]|nr:hypothetical protein C8R44DRAFT_987104 [Mycena epipterygia]